MATERLVALVPARAGSKRVVGKNTRPLNGHPLLAYAIAAAQEAGIFAEIVVSTDSRETAAVAEAYGARALLRPEAYASDTSPDIAWVNHVMAYLEETQESYDAFAILRPTSPFRRGVWVRAAWDALRAAGPRADSIRAMRPVREHPGKMWRPTTTAAAHPLLPFSAFDAPWHSMPTQQLPTVLVQTAALEIAWTRVLPASIAGDVVLPWRCAADAPESIDVNTELDLDLCVDLAAEHPEWLPVPTHTPALAAAGGWQ